MYRGASGLRSFFVVASGLLTVGASGSDGARPDELIVPPGGVVRGEINGHAVDWLIQADASNAPVVNPASAKRLGLKTGAIGIAVKVQVGSVGIKGKTGVINYRVGGVQAKRRGAWFDKPIAANADGMLGPGTLSQKVITFQLRLPRAGERLHRFALVDRGYAGMGVQWGELFVQFDPLSKETLATASAAVVIAASHDGAFDGPLSDRSMRFGIVRPVRMLQLNSPLSFAGQSIATILVRTQDYGDASNIADAGVDPDEIVVTARKKGASDRFRTVHLGADALTACSRITFDKVSRTVILSCLAD